MSKVPRSEQSLTIEEDDPVEGFKIDSLPESIKNPSEIQKKLGEKMEIEEQKEVEIKKMKAEMLARRPDVSEEKIDEVLRQNINNPELEELAKLELERKKSKQALYLGFIDLNKIKNSLKKLKQKFFKK